MVLQLEMLDSGIGIGIKQLVFQLAHIVGMTKLQILDPEL
jgi:hypothetical protein